MLTILLKILSILGIVLLVILGSLLFVLLTVLFVPVFYKIRVNRQSDWDVSVRANWLLGLAGASFLYPQPGSLRIRILFFKLFDSAAGAENAPKQHSGKGREKKGTHAREKHTKKPHSGEKPEDKTEEKTAVPGEENRSDTTNRESPRAGHPPEQDEEARQDRTKTGAESAAASGPIEKIRCKFQRIYDKIKNIRDNINHYREILLCEDTKGLLNHGFMRLGRILKSIRPRKLKADIRFGTGSPDTTGYAYAVYGILCPYLGKHVLVVPDFEQAVLEGELTASGHITVFQLLRHGVMLALDKRLRQLISKFQQED